jgi:monoamine oxidase
MSPGSEVLFATNTPEQKRLFSYACTQPEYDGRVFFAGEHISAKHRWMQGALKSGMEAANALAWTIRGKRDSWTLAQSDSRKLA